MYKEHYELRKVRNPEDLGKPGKPYCVTHYIPKDGGTWIAFGGSKYFETQAEAEAFLNAQEARLKAKEGNYLQRRIKAVEREIKARTGEINLE